MAVTFCLLAAAIEALLSAGQANTNLMVMNYVAALVNKGSARHSGLGKTRDLEYL